MSRSSAYLAGKKSRHGTQTERKRARTGYILATRTAALAEQVARSLKSLVIEEVSRELIRREFSDRVGGGQAPIVPQEPDGQLSPETPGPVEKEGRCSTCNSYWSLCNCEYENEE